MRTLKSMTVRSLVLFVTIFSLLFTVFLQGRSYAAVLKKAQKVAVTGNSGDAGTITPDLFTGTMSYSIPIEVSEGRNGMSPGLSLDYRSNNGNGWVGVGWELEVGAIERNSKNGVNYTGNEYILRISGGAMDLVQTSTNEYRAKIEGGFYRIKQLLSSDGRPYWEVTDKTGMVFTYGTTALTRQDNPSDSNKIFKWCLEKVQDTVGNFMTFSYTKEPFGNLYVNHGQIYLDRIDYTGNNTTSPSQPTTNYVKFDLEARTDDAEMYSVNFKVKTIYRLKTIEVRASNNLVGAYTLVYDTDPNTSGAQYSSSTGRSLLSSVQQFDKNAVINPTNWTVTGTALPAFTIGYQDGGDGTFAPYMLAGGPGSFVGYNLYPADVNGDGKIDIVMWNSASGTLYTRLSNGDGTFAPYMLAGGPGSFIGYDLYPADISGDGKIDIVMWNSASGTLYTRLSNGDGTFAPYVLASGPGMFVGYDFYLADISGDGKTDILLWNSASGTLYTRLSNGDGTLAPYLLASGPGMFVGYDLYLADISGDGKTDILLWSSASGTLYTRLSNGDGTLTPYLLASGPGSFVGYDLYLADVNGDRKTDILLWNSASGTLYTRLSNGDGSFAPYMLAGGSGSFVGYNLYPADINGDGKTDIIMWNSASGTLYTRLSNGEGAFAPYILAGGPGSFVGYDLYLADVNGDGKTGLIMWNSASGTLYTIQPIGLFPDLLTSISNGLGGATTITYKPSTQYSNTQLPFPVQTVSSVTANDGRGVVSTMTYTYSGGFYHVGDHDFRGFNYVMVSGPTGSNGEQIKTETWYHQGNDTAVLEENATEQALISMASVTPGYMKGKAYRTKVKNGQSTVLSETTTTYEDDTSIPYFNPALEVNSYLYGSTTVHTRTILYYGDAYGNVTKEEQYGDVNIATDDRTIERSYAINETPWIVGLLKNETVYAGIGSTTQVSHTDYYFDNAADCNAQSSSQVPTKGNVTRIVRWLSGGTNPEVRMAYDDYGNLKCTRDALGNIATVTYDSFFTFPRFATNPLGHVTEMQYYSGTIGESGLYGQVKSVTTGSLPYTAKVEYTYDAFGRKKEVKNPDNTWTRWDYNNFGTVSTQHIRTYSSAGTWSETYFDGLGRTYRTRKFGPEDKVIANVTYYNATGTVHRSSLPYFEGIDSVRWTHYTYDDLGRATEVLNEYDNTSVKACYDVLVTTGLDAEGHKKRQTKDALGRLVKVEEFDETSASCSANDAAYATTIYDYDVMGNLRFVHDEKGNTTEMRYDTLGQKYYMSDPDMGVWQQYTYNANGSLESQTDAKGQTITFSYDAINRVKTKLYPDNSQVTYTYDVTPGGPETTYPIGRLSLMSDATGTTKYFYDNMGRATISKKSIDGTEYTAVTGYEPGTGRLQNIKYPGDAQPSVWYSYDGGYLSAVKSSQSGTAAYVTYTNYTALGQPQNVTNGNGVTTTYIYRNDNSRLYSIVTKTGGPNLLSLTYEYWNNGNIKSIVDGVSGARSFNQINYDGLNRMVQVQTTGPMGTMNYVYDAIGNILSKEGIGYNQYGLNAGPHAVTMTSDGKICQYDLNGNMVDDSTRTIAYNYDNIPVSVAVSGATSTFMYDGSGARVMKISPSGATAYIGKLQECRAGTCTNYIFAGGSRIAAKSGNDITYYHQDHLGSTRVVTGANGAKLEDINYYPFGGTLSDTGGVSMSHKYTSQEFDAETGLYYYNARYYNPSLGRFISPDTIVPSPANPQALNRYSYVLNNPMIYTDPTGHKIHISHPHLSASIKETLKKPSVALLIQTIYQPAGTYLLSRSEQGRNILAGEIVAVTTVAAACTGNPYAIAAAMGELEGGYEAYRSDKDILSGVVKGGVTEVATAYAGDFVGFGPSSDKPGVQILKKVASVAGNQLYKKVAGETIMESISQALGRNSTTSTMNKSYELTQDGGSNPMAQGYSWNAERDMAKVRNTNSERIDMLGF